MAREKFGDPDYYTPPEIDRSPIGGIPAPDVLGAPDPIESGIPEPTDITPDFVLADRDEQERKAKGGEAFGLSKTPDATLSTGDEDTGWWSNAGAGFMRRAGELLENFGTGGEKRVAAIDAALADDPESGSLELDKKYLRAVTKIPRTIAGGLAAAATNKGMELQEEYGDYAVRGDWETVENSWAKATESGDKLDILEAGIQTGEFMLETGVVSLPDMIAMIGSMPAYLGSRVEELAQDRAAKNNRAPTAEDYAVGGATAVVVTGIDKLSLGFASRAAVKDVLEGGIKNAMKRIGQATALESAQEAVQEGLEYTGTTLGTDEEFSGEQLRRQSTAGAVGGAGFGATVATAAEAVRPLTGKATTQQPGETAPDPVLVEDDDYRPTDEELSVTEEDLIEPPKPKVTETNEQEASEDGLAPDTVAEESADKPFEERVRDSWKGLGLKKPQRAFVEKHGILPDEVEATGAGGSYTLGDLQRAFDKRKSPEQQEKLEKVVADAEKVLAEKDGGVSGESAGSDVAGAAASTSVQPDEAGEGQEQAGGGTGTEQQPVNDNGTAEAKPRELKFTRGTKQLAEQAGLTEEQLADLETNAQGNITRKAVEQRIREVNRADRGDVSPRTAEVLNFVDDNFPTGNYDTEKTGRTRQGKLTDKVAAVSSLVELVDQLGKNSSAPVEVRQRAAELANQYKRIGKVSAEQESGKGFTKTIKAGVLDPLLDELTELATALDQGRAAKEGTIKESTLKAVEAEAVKAEDKVREETGKSGLSTTEVAETKAKLASRRSKLRRLKQEANRIKGAQERSKALANVTAAEEALKVEEETFSKKAGVVEKEAPTAKKRAKAGETVKSGKSEVVGKKFTSATEARNVMSKLGVPESVTGVEGKVSDLPIDVNHYSLMVGAYKKFRADELAAAKAKDAKGEQEAKRNQKKLADVTKDIISTPDELVENAHTRAAGALAKLDLPKSAIDDIIDFAENARRVTQREQKRAADTTEEIREIAAEEDFAAEEGQGVDLETQVAEQAAPEGDLQEQYDAAVDAGNFDQAEKILAQMRKQTDKVEDAGGEQMIYGEDTESDTTLLSDEYDYNEAAGAYEGYYSGDEFVDMRKAPGYFGDPKRTPKGHSRATEAQSRSLATILDAIMPNFTDKAAEVQKKFYKSQRRIGDHIVKSLNLDPGQPVAVNAEQVLRLIHNNIGNTHPYKWLANAMLRLGPNVNLVFQPTGTGIDRANAYHDPTEGAEPIIADGEIVGYRYTEASKPTIVMDPVRFMNAPADGIRILMHEFVHHYTVASTRMDNKTAQYIDQLRIKTLQAIDDLEIYGTFRDTTRQIAGGDLYGLTNVDEFIAEAFTNPEFQYLLMGLEAERVTPSGKKSGVNESIWKMFVKGIKAMLGIQQVPNSVLEEVIAHSDNLFYKPAEAYAPGGEFRAGDRIQTYWRTDVIGGTNSETGERVPVRVDREAGEESYSVKWERDEARTVDAARENLGGERGADWGRQAHRMLRGDDPELVEDFKDGSEPALERIVRKLTGSDRAEDAVSKAREIAGSVSLAIQTMDQIQRNHADKFRGKLEQYMDILRDKNRIAQRWQNRGAAIDEQWEAVEKAGNAPRFSEYVNDVTMAELHPDMPWDKQKHLFSKAEQKVKKTQHAELSARFNRLSAKEKKLFKDMRNYFTAGRKEQVRTFLRHAVRTHVKDPTLADDIFKALQKHGSVEAAQAAEPSLSQAFDEIPETAKDTFDRVINAAKVRGAYFPLRRYGDWVVEYSRKKDLGTFDTKKEAVAATREWQKEHPSNRVKKPVKTDDGKYHAVVEERGVEFFETTSAGKRYIKQLRQQGWETEESPTLKEDWGGRFDIGALQVLSQAKKKYSSDVSSTKAEKERNKAITRSLDTAFIELLADTSIRKSTLQRKNVRGASLDGRRVFAERVFAGSYALADAETSFDQNNALQEIWNVAREGGPQAYKQGQVARELTLRERHTVNDRQSNRFNDWVGSIGFLWFLAGPSYPMVNATQPYMVGLPWLGARYGVKATGTLFNNAAKLGPAVMKELIDSGMGVKRNPHQAVQNAINAMAKRGGGGAEMLRAMRDAGIMDSTFIDAVSEAAKAGSWNISQASIFKFAASAPKVVEVMNRTVMAATAYQLEMEKSGDKNKAINTAKEAIVQTQFDYSDFNKPRWFKNSVARPFLLFKMYPQGIYALLASSIKQMTAGDPEASRIGRNTILGLAASHTVMAGALGGIFMEPVRMLLSVAEMLWPWDDDDRENMPFWDKQQFDINMRQMAVDIMGDEFAAELVMRGIPRAVGLDLSGRLGLHNLMFMGMADDGTGKNIIHKGIEQLGGAPLSVVMSWQRAYAFARNGDMYRAMETASPKALRDIMGTVRAGTQGLETFSGTKYARPSEFEPLDHFFKVMGFNSAKRAELMEERWAQMSYDKKMMARRTEMLNRLDRGAISFAELNKTWNAKHPDYRITMGDLLKKRAGQMKGEMLSSKGYPLDPRKRSIRREARF